MPICQIRSRLPKPVRQIKIECECVCVRARAIQESKWGRTHRWLPSRGNYRTH